MAPNLHDAPSEEEYNRELADGIAAMAGHRDPAARYARDKELTIDWQDMVLALSRLSDQWGELTGGMGEGHGPFIDVSGSRSPGAPNFPAYLAQMLELHVRKNTDYVGSHPDPLHNYVRAGQSIDIKGWRAAFMRMSEKMSRLENLLRNQETTTPMGETIEDSFLDIAVIALITLDLWRENR